MKPSLTLRLLLALALFAAGPCLRSVAQDLPRAVLQLPPRPAPISAAPNLAHRAGLPFGPAPVFAAGARLTLPEKPSATGTAASLLAQNSETSEANAEIPVSGDSGNVPDDLLQPSENPLLPALAPAPGGAPDSVPDLLSTPGEPPTSGFIEMESPGADAVPAPAAGDLPDPESSAVPASDLSPAPDKTPDSAGPHARGPLFRVKGSEAFNHTRALGYRFTPGQGMGRRDGIHTVASQVPNVLTSEVHGTRMMQLRPSPFWTTPYIQNTFYMFCDPACNAVRLQPGWKIRGIQLKGPNWQWVVCPKSGANTASFSIRIRAWKTVDTPAQGSVVTLEGLTLEGPPGATNWKAAFPTLLRPASLAARR